MGSQLQKEMMEIGMTLLVNLMTVMVIQYNLWE